MPELVMSELIYLVNTGNGFAILRPSLVLTSLSVLRGGRLGSMTMEEVAQLLKAATGCKLVAITHGKSGCSLAGESKVGRGSF